MDRECYLCKTTVNVEEHHVFFGRGLRKLSEKYGMVVNLCNEHHTGNGKGAKGVHFNRDLDLYFKRMFQAKFEGTHSREEFMRIFGRNYL